MWSRDILCIGHQQSCQAFSQKESFTRSCFTKDHARPIGVICSIIGNIWCMAVREILSHNRSSATSQTVSYTGGSFNLPHAENHVIVLLPHALTSTATDIAEVMKTLAEVIPNSNADTTRGLNMLISELGVLARLLDLGLVEDIDKVAEIVVSKQF
jgi:hypothetical protein